MATSYATHQGADRSEARHDAEDGAEEGMEWVARAGLVARGVLFVVVGILAVQLALGHRQDRTDTRGALAEVAQKPGGKILAALMAVGLAGYALWRFAQAIWNPEDKKWWKRIGLGALGVVYASLAVSAVRLAVTAQKPQESEQQKGTARLLGLPAGRWLVMAVGVGVIVAGGVNIRRAVKRKFEKGLKEAHMSQGERSTVRVIGIGGFLARGVVFGLVGVFLIEAAWRFDPKDGVGLDGALRKLATEPWGPAILLVLAAGLFLFGLFSLVQVRYLRVLRD